MKIVIGMVVGGGSGDGCSSGEGSDGDSGDGGSGGDDGHRVLMPEALTKGRKPLVRTLQDCGRVSAVAFCLAGRRSVWIPSSVLQK